MIGIYEFLLGSILVVLLPANITLWVLAIRRGLRLQPLVPWHSRRDVPWSGIDLLLVLAVSLLVVSTSHVIVEQLFGISVGKIENLTGNERTMLMFASSMGMLTAGALGAIVVRLRTGATRTDLGFESGRLADGLILGLVGFAMMILPVLLLQAALTKLFPQAGQHPFVELVQKSHSPSLMVAILVMAVGFAPLTEEFLFRVLLQGWLERIIPATSSHSLLVRSHAAQPWPVDVGSESSPATSEIKPLFFDINPYQPPGIEIGHRTGTADQGVTNWWPIVISSFAFAAMHLGQGPAPIPLFVLALGLGYLYQRTHRIWPSLTMHAMVNLFAVLQLQVAMERGL